MPPAGKKFQHPDRIIPVLWLAQDFRSAQDHRVGGYKYFIVGEFSMKAE